MKHVYLTFNWVFGVFFLLAGLPSLFNSPLAGLSLIAAAALLLPPVRNFVYSKTKREFPAQKRAVSVFILFMAFGFFIGQGQDRKEQELMAQHAQEKAEKAAQLQQENIDYFNTNREQIVYAVKKALSEKDYHSVISQSSIYLMVGDMELEQMNAQAKDELASIEKAKKTENLLAELKNVPVQEYEKNRSLYQELANLHPDNDLYKTKVAFYAGKVEEEKQKQIEAHRPSGTVIEKTLATASDKAADAGLYHLKVPFRRPFQYVGMSVADAEKLTGGKPNSARNIVIDSDRAHMVLESEGNFISFVYIELKQTAPCSLTRAFESEAILGALSINPSELDFVRKETHSHTYYDHKRKLKVSVSCQYDGGPLSAGFSSKYYGM